MNDIFKSILLGVATISIWIAASIHMNDKQNDTDNIELIVAEQVKH